VGTDLWLSQFRTSLSDYSNTVERFALLNSRASADKLRTDGMEVSKI